MKNPNEIFEDFELPINFQIPVVDEPPFLVYRGRGSRNLEAEDKVFYSINDYTIEYYFIRKDEELESRIEEQFNKFNIPWTKSSDTFIVDENVNVIYYSI